MCHTDTTGTMGVYGEEGKANIFGYLLDLQDPWIPDDACETRGYRVIFGWPNRSGKSKASPGAKDH